MTKQVQFCGGEPKVQGDCLNSAMRKLALEVDAIARTIGEWRAAHPGMGLLALLPEAEAPRLPLLQQVCRELEVPLAGAIFPALLSSQGFCTEGLWLLRLDRMAPAFLIPDIHVDAQEAAGRIASAVEACLASSAPGERQRTLFMVFDGLVGHIASLLDSLYLRLADRVAYAGVNAGSESFQPMPCLFDNHQVIGNGVLGLLLADTEPTVLEHGYPVPERVMTATSTEGNSIHSIDWQPAFDVYQGIIRDEYGIELTRDNFYQYAVHFPVGMLRANNEVAVRIPVALADDGSLVCIGEVPENAVLTLLRAPAANSGECITRLGQRLGGHPHALGGRHLLAFYCAGRRLHLGEGALTELSALQTQTDAASIGGALSLGEIGSTSAWGYPMFHNATLVCTPWHRA